MASEKILNQKKEEVAKLAEKMKEAKLILFTDYRGINVADDTALRKDLRNVNATCNIIKNNITRRALVEAGIEGLDEKLVGPTAVIMSNEDYLEASKIIYKFSKDNEYYQIKGGVIDGKVMSAEEIITLAKLPSREALLSMLAGALLANISKVAVALNEVKKQKEEAGEKVAVSVPAESASEVAEEDKAEEPVAETTAEA
ncbi:50S ribosomal protein L10 [bacterium]|nr:50S ribosomal protein L10 [bacterium]